MHTPTPILLAVLMIVLIGLTSPAFGQVVSENVRLLPSDGFAFDLFGHAIATDNHIVAVGAFQDDDNGNESGSAYLFDASNGDQLLKILPNDGAAHDEFGYSIALSNGLLAVGAQSDDDLGNGSGSAYVFDAVTGAQITKLLPSDGATGDHFGRSIAISNSIVVVGAPSDDDMGPQSGSVYVFNLTTGTQIKLLPSDGATEDRFGKRVAIANDIVIVGSLYHDDNGSNSGAAYLFDALTGTQIAKLLPSDGAAGDQFSGSVAISDGIAAVGAANAGAAYLFDAFTGVQTAKLVPVSGITGTSFGVSIAISKNVVVVGASGDDENAPDSGAAYLFDATTGDQLAKLLASDGAASDYFGFSIDIDNGIVATGVRGARLNGPSSGSAYVFSDRDEDGLFDDWEINGIPYVSNAGLDLRFMLPGADFLHKDLYIEVDAMAGLGLSSAAIALLENAFANAPLTNPDGFDGITLHVLNDDTNLPHVPVWQTNGCWPLDFDTVKTAWFGTAAERTVSDPASLLAAKSKAYRYCIVADAAAPNPIGGCGQRPGDNFVIFIGGGAYTYEDTAAVFMHELGHNLDLQHGGGDGVNGKPNYPSIMNYVFSYRYNWNRSFWSLDYTRQDGGNLGVLDESSLDETAGIGFPGGFYDHYWMPFGISEFDAGNNTIRGVRYVSLDGQQTDFGDTIAMGFPDGIFNISAQQDLNYVTSETNAPPGIPSTPSYPEILNPYDDWGNVTLPLAASFLRDAPAVNYPTNEVTTSAQDWIDQSMPIPPGLCIADLTHDGVLDFFDVSIFLQAFIANQPLADFTGDGVWNFFDVSAFLVAFSAGCP